MPALVSDELWGAVAPHLGEGEQTQRIGVRLDAILDDPSADTPSVEFDAHHRADPYERDHGVRDEVVEDLADRRYVWEYPHDPGRRHF